MQAGGPCRVYQLQLSPTQVKSLECVKTLISLEADVNIETAMGMTPLDFATLSNRLSSSDSVELDNLDPTAESSKTGNA